MKQLGLAAGKGWHMDIGNQKGDCSAMQGDTITYLERLNDLVQKSRSCSPKAVLRRLDTSGVYTDRRTNIYRS
jgi:hypothetical protein